MNIHTKHIVQTLASSVLLTSSVCVSAQTAVFHSFRYEGHDKALVATTDSTLANPVLPGFYPDPSVCRKGDEYFLVNSSFAYFPGVPIFKSDNLFTWRQIGHVLDRCSQLPLEGHGVSEGIFAPAISYCKKNDTFYMITTNVRKGNFVVKSKNPEKGWSEPVYLPQIDGIDPSLFFDRDGKAYVVHNAPVMGGADYEGQRAIRLLRYDINGDSIVGKPVEIVRGGTHVDEKPIWIEGPHLYHIGKYYYLMCAEGGTGFRHSEVIFRAKSPYGPWEECPFNPILTQRDIESPITTTGHADLVQKADGSWWAVFLGCRPYKGDMYNTGRETFLLPVTWRDGWPVILEQGKQVPAVLPINTHGVLQGNDVKSSSFYDDFTGDSLSHRWVFLRNPSDFYSVGNGLVVKPSACSEFDKGQPSAIFFRQHHTDFSASASLSFLPQRGGEKAGMMLFQNEKYCVSFSVAMLDGKPSVIVERTENGRVMVASMPLPPALYSSQLSLRIDGRGGYADFYWSPDGKEWKTLAVGVDVTNLSTQKAGGFVGTMISLFACN